MLFTENETNYQRLFGGENESPYVKDSINDYVVHGEKDAVNPAKSGTKAAAHYVKMVAPGETVHRAAAPDRRRARQWQIARRRF